MSRVSVFPTENEKWTLKMSIGSRISQLSKKDHPARTLSIQPPITKNHSTQKWKEGLMNFIAESKRQITLDARDTIKRVEQWQRQSCAMFDMVQQHILHNHDDRHESIAVNNNTNEKPSKKVTVNGSSAKKSSTAAKKPPAIAKKTSVIAKKLKKIAKKPSMTAKVALAAASNTFTKKPSTAIGTAKKTSSTSSIKQKVANSSKGTAHNSVNQSLDCLPDLSSDSSSDESTENLPVAKEVSCPSMPVIQTEEIESDDSLKSFIKKPIGLTAESVKKRRQSDFALTPSSEFALRKKSMTVHSSVLAIMNKSPSKIVVSKSYGDPEIDKEISSTRDDKTNGIPKIVEKEPEPIPNFLKSKIPEKDDFYTNFEKLRQRMNEAKKAALKVNASNGSNGEASGQVSPIQVIPSRSLPSIDE